ncbi:hypothetical protein [Arthrobacter bambusae]|uniref:DUF3592 domain-containing protein n=1 Tax=Arthrobacter bambusae TaxID=1338426 RepID=A0AAW8DA00_9MICC|nr:hypothetical protein [Arthrobacter bambusae]MDP9904565.1 hypothetical protein [Arthrobacter bambusae]MDQ0129380.1 hypothetical protein [Arthrobacter bambusae]MDQ0181007.1 hypothetical protein [Arthrobacter bambusae]
MTEAQLAPGVVLQVARPFGDTPACRVDSLLTRTLRRARTLTVMTGLVLLLGVGLVWWIGQPIWGGWPQTDGTVTSQREETHAKGGFYCTLQVQYTVDGHVLKRPVIGEARCSRFPAPTATVRIEYSPLDASWVALTADSSVGRDVFGLALILFIPLPGLTTYPLLHWTRCRAVRRSGKAPWSAVTVTVLEREASRNTLHVVLAPEPPGSPAFSLDFGAGGIDFSAVPDPGNVVALRVGGNGDGKVLVRIPAWGRDAEGHGAIRPARDAGERE